MSHNSEQKIVSDELMNDLAARGESIALLKVEATMRQLNQELSDWMVYHRRRIDRGEVPEGGNILDIDYWLVSSILTSMKILVEG
jgi:hemerythrin